MPTLSVSRTLLIVGCSSSLAACSFFHGSDTDQANLSSAKSAPEAVVQAAIVPTIVNPGFEQEWEAWDELPAGGDFTAISDDASSGNHSAKITDNGGRFEQTVAVQPNTSYQLSALVRGIGEIGVKLPNETVTSDVQEDGSAWLSHLVTFNSGDASEVVIFGAYAGGQARLDDFAITPIDGS